MGYGLYRGGTLASAPDRGDVDLATCIARDWAVAASRDDDAFMWIGLADPEPGELVDVQRALGLPQLLIDDALNPSQRPIVDWHGETSGFIVVKILQYVDSTSDVLTGQLAIFFDHSHVVTVRHGGVGALDKVRQHVNRSPRTTVLGPLAVVHAILDQIVDGYVATAEGVAQDIAEVEVEVFSPGRSDVSEIIYKLKRENLEIRRAVTPLYSAADLLVSRRSPAIPSDLSTDYQDLGEHIMRVADQTESHDALLSSVLAASMSRQSLRQNEDMRRISAWVAIAAMPTMIAGIYGMNFSHMPELAWQFGYGGALVLMGAVCAALWRSFRKSGWL